MFFYDPVVLGRLSITTSANLKKGGFVEFGEQRPKGNCLERVVRATARSYVISPVALGAMGLEASQIRDRFSAAYLVSAAARTIGDVTVLRQRADKAGKKLATLTVETEIRFANAKARHEFSEELLNAIANLALKYHEQKSEGGRKVRFLAGGYPAIAKEEPVDGASLRLARNTMSEKQDRTLESPFEFE